MDTVIKKIWTREQIQSLIDKKDEFVGRCLKQLLFKQTSDEAEDGVTKEKNGQGFNSVDAFILTSFANQFIEKGYLSEKQLSLARKKLKKYVGQLTAIANY